MDKALTEPLLASLSLVETCVSKYLISLPRADAFRFTYDEQKEKQARQAYRRFTVSFTHADVAVTEALLPCHQAMLEADRQMRTEKLGALNEMLTSIALWHNHCMALLEENDATLAKDRQRFPSLAIQNHCGALLEATRQLIRFLKGDTLL